MWRRENLPDLISSERTLLCFIYQRVERQRNEALTNAENQAQAHQAYKADMTQRLKKVRHPSHQKRILF